jgi:hypothetical protein
MYTLKLASITVMSRTEKEDLSVWTAYSEHGRDGK